MGRNEYYSTRHKMPMFTQNQSMLEGLLNLQTEDMQLVMNDGVLKTSKFLLMNIFPQLSDYVPGYIISYQDISIHLPDHTTQTVREAFENMVTLGDTTDLAVVLGFGIAEQSDNEYQIENVNIVVNEDSNISDIKPIKEEMNFNYSSETEINLTNDQSEMLKSILKPILKEVKPFEEKINRRFKCAYCNMAFRNQFNVTRHMAGVHQRTINCNICDLVFDGKQNYQNHMKDCVYRCKECSKTFRTRRNRDRHVPRAHLKKVSCERCKLEFDGNHSYQVHAKECFYRCDRCEYVHKREGRMKGHKRGHMNQDRKESAYTERIVVLYK